MRALVRLAAGLLLAAAVSSAANASTINMSFPTTDPEIYSGFAACGPIGRFGHPCHDRYIFTLDDPVNVSVTLTTKGYYDGYDWWLARLPPTPGPTTVVKSGSGGSIVGSSVLADFLINGLDAGTYAFNVVLKTGIGRYQVTFADPLVAAPIPAAGLLFLSGLGALGLSRRKSRKTAATQTTGA